jgi:hypothetical protein
MKIAGRWCAPEIHRFANRLGFFPGAAFRTVAVTGRNALNGFG